MQATRRAAAPLRVHQIWDALEKCGSQAPGLEKLMAKVTSLYRIPSDDLQQEVENAIADKLILSEPAEGDEGGEVYSIPEPEKIEKGDHDWYCFHCHLGGPTVKCEDCPRVFHLDCLPEDRKPNKDLFVCPPCHIMATKPSSEKVNVKQKPLNTLIEYVCERFTTWQADWMEKAEGGKWAVMANRSEKQAWRFNALVYMSMDLDTMLDKAQTAKYQSLEEFQVDCEILVHAIGVYFGPDMVKGNQIGGTFFKDIMHDIQEIKLCHQCFRRSNEKENDWWFCLPCTPPHDVVFAKQAGYPYWPAKVMKREGNKYDVRYFGGNYERAHIDSKNIQPIDTALTKLKVRKTALWNEAYEELKKFQEIATNPTIANELPSKGKKGANKRASSGTNEEATPKKRKSEPAPSTTSETTPMKSPPKKTATSAKAVLKTSKKEASPKTNGTSASTPVSQPAKRRSDSKDSSKKRGGGSEFKVTSPLDEIPNIETLDTELKSIILEQLDEESLGGDVCFSDEESTEPHDKVSEDAVSSSCNEGKATRNAYVQTSRQGVAEIKVQRLISYINHLKEQSKAEIEQNKKKQWCFNCGREAIYHCCWNTAYCSIECQQQHWTAEHKRLCRRVRRDRGGVHDDY